MAKNKQLGPSKILTCKGCSMLNTNVGFMNFHHACKKGVWDGFMSTNRFTYPSTPDTCPYL